MFNFRKKSQRRSMKAELEASRRVQSYLLGEQISLVLTMINSAQKSIAVSPYDSQRKIRELRDLSVALVNLAEARELMR